MTAIQDVLDVVALDWRPTRVESRRAIVRAINEAARTHRGLVHASTVREHLPEWVAPAQVGAVICAAVRQGFLRPTGRYRPNGGESSRNRTKASEVRRLVRPLPLDTFDRP
jgi:hypothetical protein